MKVAKLFWNNAKWMDTKRPNSEREFNLGLCTCFKYICS